MRKLLILISVLALSCAVRAQGKTATWDNLNKLQAGEKIQVRAMNAKRVTGTFVSLTDAAITVQTEAGSQSIQRQDVRTVKRMAHGHRLRNTVIVAGIGAGAGAGITAETWEKGGFLGGKGVGAAVGAVIGGVGGAIVGALLPSHETVYSANTQ